MQDMGYPACVPLISAAGSGLFEEKRHPFTHSTIKILFERPCAQRHTTIGLWVTGTRANNGIMSENSSLDCDTIASPSVIVADGRHIGIKRTLGGSGDDHNKLFDAICVESKRLQCANAKLQKIQGAFLGTETTGVRSSMPPDRSVLPESETAQPLNPLRMLYTFAPSSTRSILGNVQLVHWSWASDIKVEQGASEASFKPVHPTRAFPTAVRVDNGLINWHVEHNRPIEVQFRLVYASGGIVYDMRDVMAATNSMGELPEQALEFELSLIYSNAKGTRNKADKPHFDHFKPGKCFGIDACGNKVTNLFNGFQPGLPEQVFSATCKEGNIIFSDIKFNNDVLSSNCAVNGGCFRFLIAAKHKRLQNVVNFIATTPAFRVMARVR